MRLRNVPGSRDKLLASEYCVNNPYELKGKWKELFRSDNPIHVEIGMGKGKFITRMAAAHPEINYIGIEMYSSVLIRAVELAESLAEEPGISRNFVFIRMDAREITQVFDPGEVNRIYLNFSDPWPKERHAKRRLTSERFLSLYEKILRDGSSVEFKTDNAELFDFSLDQAASAGWKVLAATKNLRCDESMSEGNIMTEYEEKFASRGVPVCKMIISKAHDA